MVARRVVEMIAFTLPAGLLRAPNGYRKYTHSLRCLDGQYRILRTPKWLVCLPIRVIAGEAYIPNGWTSLRGRVAY